MLFRFKRRPRSQEGGTLPGEGAHPDVEIHESVAPDSDRSPERGAPAPLEESPARDDDRVVLPPAAPQPPATDAPGEIGLTDPAGAHPVDASTGGAPDGRDLTEPSSASPPSPPPRRRRRTRQQGAAMTKPRARGPRTFTVEQRQLVLAIWEQTGLSAKDLGALVGVSPHTLYGWRHRLKKHGVAGLGSKPRGPAPNGSRLPAEVQRTILSLKEDNPGWGIDRIAGMLSRWHGISASPGAIQRVLKEAGYEVISQPTRPHRAKEPQRFERARPNELWQSDLFSFVLKRQGTRVHLVAFLDDHSRFVVGFSLYAIASGAMVRETFEAACSRWSYPTECLTDRGPQYHTWRGKSAFTKLCERRGVKHIVARAKHPETVGKTERFWGTLWRELVDKAVFRDIDDARSRIGLFIDWYNFIRAHQSLENLVPADRFFEATPEIKETLRRQVADNALELAKHGIPKKPLYLSGRVGDLGIVSLHAEGDRMILVGEDGRREEVDLAATGRRAPPGEATELPAPVTCNGVPGALEDGPGVHGERAPGTSPLDAGLEALDRTLGGEANDSAAGDSVDDAADEAGEDDDGDDNDGDTDGEAGVVAVVSS